MWVFHICLLVGLFQVRREVYMPRGCGILTSRQEQRAAEVPFVSRCQQECTVSDLNGTPDLRQIFKEVGQLSTCGRTDEVS